MTNPWSRRPKARLVSHGSIFAQQEKDVLLGVTNARAKVGSIQATPEVRRGFSAIR